MLSHFQVLILLSFVVLRVRHPTHLVRRQRFGDDQKRARLGRACCVQ